MKVKDILNNLPSDSIVAIGVTSGYVYIGKAGDTEMIEKCFQQCLTVAKEQFDDYEKSLWSLVMNPPRMDEDKPFEDNVGFVYARAKSVSNLLNLLKLSIHISLYGSVK